MTFVWTHDSIGLGEDGPTHQPVEHLWALRAIPGLDIVRPADARETALAWLAVMGRRAPVGLILSRQALPVLAETQDVDIDRFARGAYVLADADGETPDALIIATGSEVHLALQAREQLATEGLRIRVVSAPCLEWFEAQGAEYRDSVLPPDCAARISVEAGSTIGWYRYVTDRGRCIGLDHFGASADEATLYREFGITAEAISQAVRDVIAHG